MAVDGFWDRLERRVATGTLDDGVADPAPPGIRQATLDRLIGLEAHHLRRPDLAGHAVTAAQQLLGRALTDGDDTLAAAARERIEARGLLALAGRWRTRPPSPALRRVLDGHGDAVTALVLDPDGRLLSLDASGGTATWDPATGLPAAPLIGYGPEALDAPRTRAIAVSADGGLIAVAGTDDVVRVRAAHGPEVTAFDAAEVTVLLFTTSPPGATLLVLGTATGTLEVVDIVSGARVSCTDHHDGPVTALTATVPGTVLSGGADAVLLAHDTGTGLLTAALDGDSAVVGFAATGTDELLAATGDGLVHVLTPADGVPAGSEILDATGVAAVVAAPAGPGCALVGRTDGTVELWRTGATTERIVLTGHRAPVRAAAASADGTVLATGDDHGRVLVWDPAAAGGGVYRPSPAVPADRAGGIRPIGAVVFTADLVVSAPRGSGPVVARDRDGGGERWRITTDAAHLWSDPAGAWLFAASGGTVTELHAGTGVRTGTATVPGRVLAGRGTLVVFTDDERIALADARTGRVYRSLPLDVPPRRATITPGGGTVLFGTAGTLTAWTPGDGAPATVALPGSLLTAVAVDDEGRHALAADADGRAHLWTLGTDRVTTVRADPVQLSAAVGAAGHRAVTAGACGTAVLWDLAAATPLGRAPMDAPLTALDAVPGRIVVGDGYGDTHCLDVLESAGATLPEGTIPRQSRPARGAAWPVPAPRRDTGGGLLRRLLRG